MAIRYSIWLDGCDDGGEMLVTRSRDVTHDPDSQCVTLTINPEGDPITIEIDVAGARELRDFLSSFVRDVDAMPREERANG